MVLLLDGMGDRVTTTADIMTYRGQDDE